MQHGYLVSGCYDLYCGTFGRSCVRKVYKEVFVYIKYNNKICLYICVPHATV